MRRSPRKFFVFALLLSLAICFSACHNRPTQILGGAGVLSVVLEGRLQGSSASFAGDSLTVSSGSRVELKWSIQGDPSSCSLKNLTPEPDEILSASLTSQGQRLTDALNANALIELRCVRNGAEDYDRLTINVTSGPPTLDVTLEGRLEGSGSYSSSVSVQSGQKVDLKWTILGNPTSCRLRYLNEMPVVAVVIDPVSGSQTTDTLTESFNVELVCEKGNESDASTLTVTVAGQSTLAPPFLEARVSGIGSFVENNVEAYAGERVEFKWTISGNPTSCSLKNTTTDTVVVADAKSVLTGLSDPLQASSNFELKCTKGNLSSSDSLHVSVTPSPDAKITKVGSPNTDFGTLDIGTSSSPLQFRIQNNGNVPIAGISWTNPGIPFHFSYAFIEGSGSTCQNVILQPGAHCDFSFTFSPVAETGYDVPIALSFRYLDSRIGLRNVSQTVFSLQGRGRVHIEQGILDPSFGNAGVFEISSYFDPKDVLVRPDGKIVVLALSNTGGLPPILLQLNQDGTRDTSFGVGTMPSIDGGVTAFRMAQQLDGKIVVGGFAYGGSAGNRILLFRINTDGSFDQSFGNQGAVVSTLVKGVVWGVFVQPDGKILACGNEDGTAFVIRLNPNGSFDSSFGLGGVSYLSPAFIGGSISLEYSDTLTVDQSGNIYVQALADFNTGNYEITITKLSPNGYVAQGDAPFVRTVNDVIGFWSYRAFHYVLNQYLLVSNIGTPGDLGPAGIVSIASDGALLGSRKYSGRVVGSALRTDNKLVLIGPDLSPQKNVARLLDTAGNVVKVYSYAQSPVTGTINPIDNKVIVVIGSQSSFGVSVVRFLP